MVKPFDSQPGIESRHPQDHYGGHKENWTCHSGTESQPDRSPENQSTGNKRPMGRHAMIRLWRPCPYSASGYDGSRLRARRRSKDIADKIEFCITFNITKISTRRIQNTINVTADFQWSRHTFIERYLNIIRAKIIIYDNFSSFISFIQLCCV